MHLTLGSDGHGGERRGVGTLLGSQARVLPCGRVLDEPGFPVVRLGDRDARSPLALLPNRFSLLFREEAREAREAGEGLTHA